MPGRVTGSSTAGLSWLVRLRWVAVLGQLGALAVAAGVLHLRMPWVWALVLVGAVAASNLLLQRQQGLVGPALFLDVALLTGLLALSGGAENPFSIFYLVHVTLAAILLSRRWAWALVVFSAAGYGALFLVPASGLGAMHEHHGFPLHLQGMWVAFTLAAGLIAHFVSRIAEALRSRSAELVALQGRAARHEKLAALSTLAAGAAHELNTPLGTIFLAATELSRQAHSALTLPADAVASDAALIEAEVSRCRNILQRMAAGAGTVSGEGVDELTLADLFAAVGQALTSLETGRVRFDVESSSVRARLPKEAVVQGLVILIRNGLDAGPDQVAVAARAQGERLRVEVSDQGSGMSPEVLARAGEPFFTTKSPGKGTGLGLFLARAVVDRLGGTLELTSTLKAGTRVLVELPLLAR